jgi:DNA-binding FrmR family transcriptional regulator
MLDAFQRRVLADHLNGCVTTAIRSQQPAERARVVDELLQVFHTSSTL